MNGGGLPSTLVVSYTVCAVFSRLFLICNLIRASVCLLFTATYALPLPRPHTHSPALARTDVARRMDRLLSLPVYSAISSAIDVAPFTVPAPCPLRKIRYYFSMLSLFQVLLLLLFHCYTAWSELESGHLLLSSFLRIEWKQNSGSSVSSRIFWKRCSRHLLFIPIVLTHLTIWFPGVCDCRERLSVWNHRKEESD